MWTSSRQDAHYGHLAFFFTRSWSAGLTLFLITQNFHTTAQTSAPASCFLPHLSGEAPQTRHQVELVPKVNYPKGIQTPDYLVDGERFDLKTLTGKGKYLLEGAISKKQRQSHNFIIDVSSSPLDLSEIYRQADSLYKSKRTGFLEKLVIIKNEEIVKVYGRK